jgi:hypothetical protein
MILSRLSIEKFEKSQIVEEIQQNAIIITLGYILVPKIPKNFKLGNLYKNKTFLC